LNVAGGDPTNQVVAIATVRRPINPALLSAAREILNELLEKCSCPDRRTTHEPVLLLGVSILQGMEAAH
jgi:hypothetical protein